MNWRLATGAAMAALTSPALAQNGPQVAAVQVDPDRPDWENPAVNASGTRPASATAFPDESRALALASDRARSSRFLSLDGAWSFAFPPRSTVPPRVSSVPITTCRSGRR